MLFLSDLTNFFKLLVTDYQVWTFAIFLGLSMITGGYRLRKKYLLKKKQIQRRRQLLNLIRDITNNLNDSQLHPDEVIREVIRNKKIKEEVKLFGLPNRMDSTAIYIGNGKPETEIRFSKTEKGWKGEEIPQISDHSF